MPVLRQAIWENIWKRTVEKSPTNATNAILHPPMCKVWRLIWKHTVEKSQTNATNVTLHPLRQAIWGDIWKHTVEKSQTSATNVTLPALSKVLWGDIWRGTVKKGEKFLCHRTHIKVLRVRIQIEINISRFTFGRVKFIYQSGDPGMKQSSRRSIFGWKKMVLNKSTVSRLVTVLKESTVYSATLTNCHWVLSAFRKYMGCRVGLGEIYLEILKFKIEMRF